MALARASPSPSARSRIVSGTIAAAHEGTVANNANATHRRRHKLLTGIMTETRDYVSSPRPRRRVAAALPPLRREAGARDQPTSLLLRFVLLDVVAGDERAPGLRLDRALRLPHDVELAVCFHFADEHRLVQMVILLIHLHGESVRSLERLAAHRSDNLVRVEALRLLD